GGRVVGLRRPASSRAGEDSRRILTASDWTAPRTAALARLDTALSGLAAFAEAHDRSEALAILARRAGDLRTDLGRIRASADAEERHWEDDEPLARAARGFEGGVVWLDRRDRGVSLGASPVDLAPTLRE